MDTARNKAVVEEFDQLGMRDGDLEPDEDREFWPGRAEIVGDDADLIGTAELAVPRTRHTPR